MNVTLNAYDIERIQGILNILEVNGIDEPDSNDIIDYIKYNECNITLENVFIQLSFERLQLIVEDELNEPEVSYYINARDSHFYINDEEIDDIVDYNELKKRFDKE